MTNEVIDGKLRSKIRSALRKVWLYSPARRAVKDRARVKKGLYQCEKCGQFADKVDIDHINAVGSTPGSRNATSEDTWDRMINNMFCDENGMQAICKPCHQEITNEQRKSRAKKNKEGCEK